MIKINNVKLPLGAKDSEYPAAMAEFLHLSPQKIKTVTLFKKSLDYRRREQPHYCCTFLVELCSPSDEQIALKNKNAAPFTPTPYAWPTAARLPAQRPVIVGAGPAGLFAALTLCKAGVPPLIIEQGEPVEKRQKTVQRFWQGGAVDPLSNVQFGEGGAGTFSDGKLNTGIKDPLIRTVLKTFVEFGASKDILTDAKPHIGTDVLRRVVFNMRQEILRLGGEYLFSTKVTGLSLQNGRLAGLICQQEKKAITLPCSHLILAIGNAARPLFYHLAEQGVPLCAKAFAVGVRIEHLQARLDAAQYGPNHPPLPPSDYKLAAHPAGRGVYTFCMCPGGVVVNASDTAGSYVTNGMSYKARNGQNANAAVLVSVLPEDFGQSPLGGIVLQQQIEQAAYRLTGGKGLPAQTVGSFLHGAKNQIGSVTPTALPNCVCTNLAGLFPPFVTAALQAGLPLFGQKIKGFDAADAVLTAPETRSSSPVRILRNENFQSAVQGIFPCGEGAGYAGGITSSAVDGIHCAEKLIGQF